MPLEPLGPKDIKELGALVKACTGGLAPCEPKVLQFQAFGDPEADTSYLLKAVDKGRMLGAALGVARKGEGGSKTGYIKYFAVHPRARGRGLGTELISELERRFQKREARELRVGACPPPYLMGGIESHDTASVCFLLGRGYQMQGEIVDMTAPLSKWKPVEGPGDKALLKEFAIRKTGAKDEPALMDFAAAHFPNWAYEIRLGLEHGAVFAAFLSGKAVAFSCADGTNPGFFGPMGTAPEFRGKGLARVLLNLSLQFMKKAGRKSARIPWVGPIPFYAKYAGASLGPLFRQFSKKL